MKTHVFTPSIANRFHLTLPLPRWSTTLGFPVVERGPQIFDVIAFWLAWEGFPPDFCFFPAHPCPLPTGESECVIQNKVNTLFRCGIQQAALLVNWFLFVGQLFLFCVVGSYCMHIFVINRCHFLPSYQRFIFKIYVPFLFNATQNHDILHKTLHCSSLIKYEIIH